MQGMNMAVNKHIILSFSGKARSGKNTCAELVKELLADYTGGNTLGVEFSFATRLKELAVELFGWDTTDKETYDPEVKDKGRNLLINLAAACRDINPDVWANTGIKTIENLIHTFGRSPLIIMGTDTRYPNEIRLLKELASEKIKVICIYVIRPGLTLIDSPSERQLDNYGGFDFTVYNDGSMERLKDSLRYMLEFYGVIECKPTI
jgi:hypothetical protein